MIARRFRAVSAFVGLSLVVLGGCPGLNGTETIPLNNNSVSGQSATQTGGDQTATDPSGTTAGSQTPSPSQSSPPSSDNQSPPADPSDFTPATGKAATPPNAPITYGPWNVRLRVATSPDGLNWTRTGVTITDQGDVPSVIAADGKLWVFYVIWRDADDTAGLANTTVAAHSADLVHWTFKKLQFTDRIRGQFHVELLNAFDQPFFNVPNLTPNNSEFGKVTSTQNLPLNVQLAFKLIF